MFNPPAWSAWRRTDDIDEANAPSARIGSMRRRIVGRGPLGLRGTNVYLDGAAVGWSATAVGQLVTASTAVPLLHIPMGRPLTYRLGRRHWDAFRGHATYLSPGTDYVISHGPATPVLSIVLPAADLAGELASRGEGSPVAARVGPKVLGLDAVAAGRLGRILADVRAAGPLSDGNPSAVLLQARLVSWAADLIARGHPASKTTSLSSARLGAVEEWIDANLGEPVTLGQLCAVAGLEASSLRKSFRKRRGLSPMEWLWQRRMAAVRMRLLTAEPGDRVIHVANDCGLTHAGRFSVEYRERYGENPSCTLARSLEGEDAR